MRKQTEAEISGRFGKMIKGIHSLLLRDDQLSDTQNMQPGYGWKQRKGMSTLTATAVASGLRFKKIFQFRDLKGNTDTLLAHVYDSSNGERIMEGSALPPSAITWSSQYTLTASCENTQFAQVAGALLMANNKEFLIWRGDQHLPSGVWKYINSASAYINFYDECTDSNSSTSMSLNSMAQADFVYLTGEMPLNKVIVDIGNANSNDVWLIGEYYNGAWTILKRANWWSDTTYLNEDCDDTLSNMGFDDDDGGDGVTTAESTIVGRTAIKMDSGSAGAANYAAISKDVGTLGSSCAISVLAYHDNIGAYADVDGFEIAIDNGEVLCRVRIYTDGVYAYDGSSWNEIGTETVSEDVWNIWTLVVDSSTPASATVTVYRNGSSIGSAGDCSDTGGTSVDGDISLKQLGETTANQITYVRQIVVGDGLDTTGDAFSDGTDSSGTMAQDGNITWTAPGDEEKTIIEGIPGYAYRFSPSAALDAATSILQIDVRSPMAAVKNIWDGQYRNPTGCYVYDATDYADYTAYVNNTVQSQHAELDAATSSYKFYVGFAERVNRIILHPVPGEENSNNVSVTAIKYHSSSGSFTSVGTVTDTTEVNNATLSQKGYMEWADPGRYTEKPTKIGGDDVPKYWYEITFDATLSATCSIYYIQGVPIPDDPDYCRGTFGFKRRAWQLAPLNAENAVRYSAANLPNVWNGADSGYVYFGERPLYAAAPFYNETVIYADNEIWMLQGNTKANFGRLRLSAKVGIAAPDSLVTIESGLTVGDSIKIVLAWFFYDGIWMFDGVRIWKISSPDIDNFFDPDDGDYINTSYLDQTQGEYDFETQCAYWTVYSGSSQTTPNKVIVLHFPTLWYGIYDYGVDIGAICSVINNRYYLVAGGHASGKFYQLNTGTTDVNSSGTAVAVDAYVVTRDMFLSYSDGMKQQLLSIWLESQEAGGFVEIDEYPDGSDTPQNIAKQSMSWFGRIFGVITKRLKNRPGAYTAKFRIRNRSKNARMNLMGFSATADRDTGNE